MNPPDEQNYLPLVGNTEFPSKFVPLWKSKKLASIDSVWFNSNSALRRTHRFVLGSLYRSCRVELASFQHNIMPPNPIDHSLDRSLVKKRINGPMCLQHVRDAVFGGVVVNGQAQKAPEIMKVHDVEARQIRFERRSHPNRDV